ncbi:Hypothetical predicted protein [Pelobates cultripes]|uniref:Uncharacterized protein n=1 Tax=Pelobates cultripes TaxID=61616 RepID=A0AAD1RQZ8_PELCU|nr:Hypothetical predicted protein [Pelobates cultripes]
MPREQLYRKQKRGSGGGGSRGSCSADGIQHVGPPESYSGVPAVGNGKRSEDCFTAAAKWTKSEGGKATQKR